MGTSLNPKDQVKGGLMSDVDATVVSLRFGNFIYDWAKHNEGPPAGSSGVGLCGTFKLNDGDEYRAIYSLGGEDEWIVQDAAGNAIAPDANGYVRGGVQVESTKGNTGTKDSSNVSQLMVALKTAGYPENRINDRVEQYDNLYAHWTQQAQKKREGMEQTENKTIFGPVKVLLNGLPEDAAKRAKTAGAAAKPPTGTSTSAATKGSAPAAAAQAAATAPAGNDMENEAAVEMAAEAIPLVKAKKGGTVVKKSVWSTVKLNALQAVPGFAALAQTDPNRAAASRLMSNAEWLGVQDGFFMDPASGDVTVPAAG